MRWFACICCAVTGLSLAIGGRLGAQDAASETDNGMVEELEWMIGEWLLKPEDEAAATKAGSMRMTVRWDEGRAFLVREATLTPPAESGEPVVTLHQRIGWDPLVERIRSWSFSSDGSRAEATWFREGDSWVVRGTAVLPDGTQTNSVNIYTFEGKDRIAWRVLRPALVEDAGLPTRATWVRKTGSTSP